MQFVPTLTLTTALLAAGIAQAGGPEQGPRFGGWELNGFFEQVTINSDAAAKSLIDTSAPSFGIGGEYYFANSLLIVGGGLEGLAYSDNNKFSQAVRDNYGKTYDASSSASGTSLFVDAGIHYPLPNSLFVSAKVGATIVSSSRSIDNCNDCYKESIKIGGGGYALAQTGVAFDSFELSLSYKQYLSGDLESGLGLGISTHFY